MSSALVTGAGRGLGRAIACQLAEEGYAVVVNDIDETTAADTAADIREHGGEAIAIGRDVADESAATDLVSETVSEFDELAVLVNNAAIETVAPALELGDEDWNRIIGTSQSG